MERRRVRARRMFFSLPAVEDVQPDTIAEEEEA